MKNKEQPIEAVEPMAKDEAFTPTPKEVDETKKTAKKEVKEGKTTYFSPTLGVFEE